MKIVVGVRFKPVGKVYYFDPGDLEISKWQNVIVETSHGIEFGEVIEEKKELSDEDIINPLKQIIRVANDKDIVVNEDNKVKAKEALIKCDGIIHDYKIKMNLTDAEYTFDGSKLIFFYTADGRVDFRELVKDLASRFRVRIEMRQIGARDKAKTIGGMGQCGQQTCCSGFLTKMPPVNIQMAKDQGISLNPSKISGSCGRLMCCLRYEQSTYEEILKTIPSIGAIVETNEGIGPIINIQTLEKNVRVKIKKEDGTYEIKQFDVDDIRDTGEIDYNYYRNQEENLKN